MLRENGLADVIRSVSDLPRLDGLRIVEHVATENVADIFHGFQEPLGRPVIVKLLRPNVLPTSPFALTLEREARLMGELSHPYVQRLFDFRREETRMWLVLEQIVGPTVQSAVTKRLSVGAVVSLGAMVCKALVHCHERGIIHRDIQPKHIVLSGDGRVALTHFSGALKERLPTAPELLDACDRPLIVPYLSPEQVLGELTDGRTDIFSLGCVLYELLTGQQAFECPDDRGIAQRIRHSAPILPSRAVPGLPHGIDRIVQRCLEKLPHDRYGSALELQEALERMMRQLGVANPELALSAELARVGLCPTSTRRLLAGSSRQGQAQPLRIGRALLVLGAFSCLIVAGGLVAQRGAARVGTSSKFASRLQLHPERAGYLRIVVDPWAKITIDGQPLDTSPIAHSIPLAAGTHYAQFEHPQADTEKRVVNISVGETVLLDVKMKIPVGARADAGLGTFAMPAATDNSP